jgi:hypothetical protein
VQLNAAGVNFNQSSIRRNMDFDHLSELDRPAVISGVGYPVPSDGNHDFLLMTFVREFEFKGRDDNNLRTLRQTGAAVAPGKSITLWLWVVHGYRRTGKTITINKREYEVLDDSPGSFGSFADHSPSQQGNDIFSYEMTGGGIKHLGGSYHALRVPHNGKVEIRTRIAAGPRGSFVPIKGADIEAKGCLAGLLSFLKKLFK